MCSSLLDIWESVKICLKSYWKHRNRFLEWYTWDNSLSRRIGKIYCKCDARDIGGGSAVTEIEI